MNGEAAIAIEVAKSLGLKPRTTITICATRAELESRAGYRDPRWTAGTLHGLCCRGPNRGERLIYVDPDGPAPTESLAHELAHAVTPWRQNHSPTWLAVFEGIYHHLDPHNPAKVSEAVGRYRHIYAISTD